MVRNHFWFSCPLWWKFHWFSVDSPRKGANTAELWFSFYFAISKFFLTNNRVADDLKWCQGLIPAWKFCCGNMQDTVISWIVRIDFFALPSCGSLQWRHNEHDSVSNHQPHDPLLNLLFGRRSRKTSKLCVTGLCAGNSPGTGEFPTQRASNAENVSIWWHHHVYCKFILDSCDRFTHICHG